MARRVLVILVALVAAVPRAATAELPWLDAFPRVAEASTSDDGDAPDAEAKHVRVFRLTAPVVEAKPPRDVLGLDPRVSLSQLVEHLDAQSRSEEVSTLLLRIGTPQLGLAQAREIARALKRARDRGVRVVAHLVQGSQTALMVAAAADRVVLPRQARVSIPGIRAEITFYKELLDTLGLRAQIERIGPYKTSPEPLTRTELSEPGRQALESVVDELYRSVVEGLAVRKGLDREAAEQAVDRGLMTAKQAEERGLVDELRSWDGVLRRMRDEAASVELAFPTPRELPDLDSLFGVLELLTKKPGEEAEGERRIALVVAEGPILLGHPPQGILAERRVVASERLTEALSDIREDDAVDAAVLRIDSPGGSALASDLIWQAVDRLDETKPVVVSMGNTAASGGYYIASAARRVLAEPSTLTGSIGVFGGKIVVEGLFDKAGLETEVVSRGAHSGMPSSRAPYDEAELEVLRETMRATYDTFLDRVAEGRDMRRRAVERAARGRVWSGRSAVDEGLVDELGGLRGAIRAAAEAAGIDPEAAEVLRYPKPKSLMEMLRAHSEELRGPRLDWGRLARLLPVEAGRELAARALLVTRILRRGDAVAMPPWAVRFD